MEQFRSIMFVDIETVPALPDYSRLNDVMQHEWQRKARTIKVDGIPVDAPSAFRERAGVYAEFAKVVCIGIGNLVEKGGVWSMRLKAITGHDEKMLLSEFSLVLNRFFSQRPDLRFCGHNIKEFDLPFLSRRMIINQVPLPTPMQTQGKKPWEISHIDTMEMWRFGDYKNFTALSLLATVLGIPSPKSDIDGSMVADVYYNDNDLERIGRYCVQDVLTTAKVFLRLSGETGVNIEPVFVTD